MLAAIICALAFLAPFSAAHAPSDAALTGPRLVEPQPDTRVTGIVRDTTGAPVPNAAILLRTGTQTEQRTFTGPDGRFVITSAPAGALMILVRAGGFAEATRAIAEAGPRQDLEIVVSPDRKSVV